MMPCSSALSVGVFLNRTRRAFRYSRIVTVVTSQLCSKRPESSQAFYYSFFSIRVTRVVRRGEQERKRKQDEGRERERRAKVTGFGVVPFELDEKITEASKPVSRPSMSRRNSDFAVCACFSRSFIPFFGESLSMRGEKGVTEVDRLIKEWRLSAEGRWFDENGAFSAPLFSPFLFIIPLSGP